MNSSSFAQTISKAKKYAKTLQPGTVLALTGDLGSGKTAFIKGIAMGLGLKDQDEVKSPTFTLMHIYPTRIPLYHFDLYRLDRERDLQSIGFEDFVNDPNAIVCVEWADKARKYLPRNTRHIQLEITGPRSRRITIGVSARC